MQTPNQALQPTAPKAGLRLSWVVRRRRRTDGGGYMAFVKLFPPEGGDALPVADVIRRLEDEFAVVDADQDEGENHVAGMIAATLRFSDSLPGKQERLAWLQSVRDVAVYVSFGEDLGNVASCCVMPDSELFFGSPDEVDGPARALVERAASALGYELYPG